jgi:two-component system, OmpR family, response regulator QseB
MRLLVVDDDRGLRDVLRRALELAGYEVRLTESGAGALSEVSSSLPDAVVLDVGLPDIDGLEVCRLLRREGNRVPVLMLTARDTVSDRIDGLDAGADDYLVKPFDLDELAARIRALLRRKSGRTEPEVEHLGVALNPATHRVTRDGREIALSPKEFSLLQLLMERPGNILSRAQIEERLYGWGEEIESNAVEVHIHGLRRKLGNDFILNVRGVGYRVRPAS